MNVDRNYMHQTTFPLNTTVRFPIKEDSLLPEHCQDWKLVSSFYYFYDHDFGQLGEREKQLYERINEPIDSENMRENALRELTNVFNDEVLEEKTAAETGEKATIQEVYCGQVSLVDRKVADVYLLPKDEILCLWLPETTVESEDDWSEIAHSIYQMAPRPVAIFIPHDRIHYLCARMLFTVQLFYQRFRMIKLVSPPQLANVDRCFLLYHQHPQDDASSMLTTPEALSDLEKYRWLLPPSNDFLVKLEFTFFQMVVNECYINEQAISLLLNHTQTSSEEVEALLLRRCRHWMQQRSVRWAKIKEETSPVMVRNTSCKSIEELQKFWSAENEHQ